jgi:hypothetical protein
MIRVADRLKVVVPITLLLIFILLLMNTRSNGSPAMSGPVISGEQPERWGTCVTGS